MTKRDWRTQSGSASHAIDLERVSCPKCRADDSVILLQGQDYLYRVPGTFYASECCNCGLQFQNPRPILSQLEGIYPRDYSPHAVPGTTPVWHVSPRQAEYMRRHLGYGRLASNVQYGHDWRSRLRLRTRLRSLVELDRIWKWRMGVALIPYYVPGGKLLEIGCAAGTQLLFFRQIGWEHLYGVELVADVAEIAWARGFSVESGPIETVLDNYPDEHFDVVFSTMTLEHMYDPFQVVRDIARKLKPGGQFLCSTIVRGSLDEKRYGRYWLHYDFPRHMVYFRKTDLYEMLEDRFELIECFHQGAPQDFIWGATWRHEYDGKSDLIDRIVLKLDRSRTAQAINMYLAWLGLTSRVSFRCRRKT